MTYQWSNGQIEGQVNRPKMLKRHDERVPLRLTPNGALSHRHSFAVTLPPLEAVGRSSNVRSRSS